VVQAGEDFFSCIAGRTNRMKYERSYEISESLTLASSNMGAE